MGKILFAALVAVPTVLMVWFAAQLAGSIAGVA